ncbi:MAG: hypothetical protein ACFE9Q_05085 [Candidatus Hodarchaeota archaeon]
MAKKENEKSSYHPHDLVYFKTEEDNESKAIKSYSFEKIDQEDKIKLVNNFQPFGSHFQFSILLDNQSFAPITDLKIKINIPNFLTLSRVYPPTIALPRLISNKDSNHLTLEFDELNEKSNKQIHLHFNPNALDRKGEIRTIVSYVNNKDTIRVLDSRPAEITVDNISIEPKVVPSSFIRDFSQTPGIKKAIKSMGIAIDHEIDPDIHFDILEKIFLFNNFQLVTKDIEKKILWYFGTESLLKEDILAIGQIVSNKVEIIATSLNHYLLVSFLTLISNDFKEGLLLNGIIKSKEQIFDLECKFCGATLPYLPNQGISIECKNCNNEQIVW